MNGRIWTSFPLNSHFSHGHATTPCHVGRSLYHFFELQAIIALLPLLRLGCHVFGLVSLIRFLDSL